MINVTAATGQLGQLIVKQLLEKVPTSQVSVTVRNPAKAAALAQAGVKVHQADYGDLIALTAAFAGTDTLMFISGDALVEERIPQHRNVVKAAQAAGVKRVVYTSFVDPDPKSPFPFIAVHVDTEEKLKASGLDWVLLRPSIYADVQRAQQSLEMGFLAAPSADVGVSYITREDLARASAAVLLDPRLVNVAYPLTGPAAVSYREFAALLSEIAGREIPFKQITFDELRASLKQAGLPDFVVEIVARIQQTIGDGRVATVTNDVAELTGTPAIDFETALRQALEVKAA